MAIPLLIDHGVLESVDYLIFADVKDEKATTYKQIEWIKKNCSIPLIVVSRGHGISGDIERMQRGELSRVALPPFFTKNGSGKVGKLWRQCTREYKIEVIEREMRRLLGYKPRQRIPENSAELWMGISVDEASRMKPSRKKWITTRWPLIEIGWSVADCLHWMADNNYPVPVESSCYYCPFHSNSHWADMKKNAPGDFKKAVEVERDWQKNGIKGVNSTVYLHRSGIPIDQVNLGSDQINAFDNECEGICNT